MIKAFYLGKSNTAVRLFNEIFADSDIYVHKLEGAFFMWLWLPKLSITSEELYQQLKQENVYIIPGHNFFMGMYSDWPHKHQCIRLNYAKDETMLRKGLKAIRRAVFD